MQILCCLDWIGPSLLSNIEAFHSSHLHLEGRWIDVLTIAANCGRIIRYIRVCTIKMGT